MSLLRLAVTMSRPRGALAPILMMLCGTALIHPNAGVDGATIGSSLALLACYIVATSVNDLADVETDRLNLRGHDDRPLVLRSVTANQLRWLALTSGVASIVVGALVSTAVAELVAAELTLCHQYSRGPLRSGRRPLVAPCHLAIAYVVVPYAIGVTAHHASMSANDCRLLLGLSLLFAGRIVLKDFRDRVGDAATGKRTLLVTYGKRTVCVLSGVAIVSGAVTIGIALWSALLSVVMIGVFLLAAIVLLQRIWRATSTLDEVIAVGILARAGSGLLVTLVALSMLTHTGAGIDALVSICACSMAAYGYLVWSYLRQPDSFRFGNDIVHQALAREPALGAAPSRAEFVQGDRPSVRVRRSA